MDKTMKGFLIAGICLFTLLALLFVFREYIPGAIIGPQNNVAAQYLLDGNPNDETGLHNGNLKGIDSTFFKAGKRGQALFLPGTANKTIEIPKFFTLSADRTQVSAAAWINPTAGAWADRVIVGHYSVEGNYRSWQMRTWNVTSTQLGLRVLLSDDGSLNGNHSVRYFSSIVLPRDQWTHVAFTFNNGAVKIYINAIEDTNAVQQGVIGSTLKDTAVNVLIGCQQIGGSFDNCWQGGLDEVTIYNKAMSASEITALYNGYTAPVCGDNVCQSGETTVTCPADCHPAAVCGNSICEATETNTNCAIDCPVQVVCGNGVCQQGETCSNCLNDCATNMQYTRSCINNNVYYLDNCNTQRALYQACSNGCSNGALECALPPTCTVTNAQTSFSCHNGDIYYFDNCNDLAEKKIDCDKGCIVGSTECIVDAEPSFGMKLKQFFASIWQAILNLFR